MKFTQLIASAAAVILLSASTVLAASAEPVVNATTNKTITNSNSTSVTTTMRLDQIGAKIANDKTKRDAANSWLAGMTQEQQAVIYARSKFFQQTTSMRNDLHQSDYGCLVEFMIQQEAAGDPNIGKKIDFLFF